MNKIILTLENFRGDKLVITNHDPDMIELQEMTWAEQWTWFVKMEKAYNTSADGWWATLEVV